MMALFKTKKPNRSAPKSGNGLRKKDRAALAAVIGDEELRAFPALISEALRKISEPQFDLSSVADIIMNDPGVTTRLLALVNSAALSRGRPIANVHQAVVIVGRNQLESLLISLAVKRCLPSPRVPGFDPGRFWMTAARRAAIAGQLAATVDPSKRSENFTAALLQDMALPVLAQRAAGYSETLLNWHESPTDLVVLERQSFGWDHGEVASMMASAWDFPPELVNFLDSHHDTPDGVDTLLPAKIVAPIRESDSDGDAQLIQMASQTYSISSDKVLELVEAAGHETEHLAAMLA